MLEGIEITRKERMLRRRGHSSASILELLCQTTAGNITGQSGSLNRGRCEMNKTMMHLIFIPRNKHTRPIVSYQLERVCEPTGSDRCCLIEKGSIKKVNCLLNPTMVGYSHT